MADPLAAEARRLRTVELLSDGRSSVAWASARTGCPRCSAVFHRRSGRNGRTPRTICGPARWSCGVRDLRLLGIFLRFLEVCGIDRSVPGYRVSIHESADAEAAARWWQASLALPADRFRRPTLQRHQPKTIRYNTGDGYRGCLIIDVLRSRELYWRIEGIMAALGRTTAEGVGPVDGEALG